MSVIIVEDGSGSATANSYVAVDEAIAYAAARGITLPANPAPLLLEAMQYIESHGARFKGTPTNGRAQALQWPRDGVEIDGHPIGDDEIPRELAAAQLQMVLAVHAGVNPLATNSGKVVKRKKVDVLETEYFSPGELADAGQGAGVPAVDAALAPLLMTAAPWLRARRA